MVRGWECIWGDVIVEGKYLGKQGECGGEISGGGGGEGASHTFGENFELSIYFIMIKVDSCIPPETSSYMYARNNLCS